ncbi:MAG TPA: DNA polymerase III subunit beta [Rhodospirillaceae bacterium]|jgi:DNA polymerase-3 subunit beta|nr:DNA polymerase III subunit beta [Alphaproteobacteria bacterium]HBH26263.1 DNA polymerase III subunit beta [Rhodospirillaceae bacterium]
MKLSLDRDALARSLARVQGVVERRGTIPILANVLMRAEGGVLSLATTDMDLEIAESLPAQVSAEGATTVPAFMLHEIVRKLPTGARVDIALDDGANIVTIQAGRSRFKLSCLPVEDFPELGAGEMPTQFTLPAAQLRVLIDRTKFAMSTEETRYYLNGIYVHEHEGRLRAVATDGHRLAKFEAPLPEGAAGMPSVIVPRKAVGEVRKLIEETAGEVEVSLSASKVRFAFDHTVLTSKLIDGTFPDYERVIPEGNDKVVTLDPRLFSAAIDRVSTISEGKTRAVKLILDGQTVTISASSPEAGSATEEVELGEAAPAQMEIGFNAKYLLDITTRVEGEKIRMDFGDPSAPTLLRDADDEAALYVLMPLRV